MLQQILEVSTIRRGPCDTSVENNPAYVLHTPEATYVLLPLLQVCLIAVYSVFFTPSPYTPFISKGPNYPWWFHARFAQPYLRERAQDMIFPAYDLFTNESIFNLGGVFNQHNEHLWAHENLQGVWQHAAQYGFVVNVWADLVGNCLVPFTTSHDHRELSDLAETGSTKLIWWCSSKCEMQHVVPTGWGASQ